MKLTNKQLRQIIKEELEAVLGEEAGRDQSGAAQNAAAIERFLAKNNMIDSNKETIGIEENSGGYDMYLMSRDNRQAQDDMLVGTMMRNGGIDKYDLQSIKSKRLDPRAQKIFMAIQKQGDFSQT